MRLLCFIVSLFISYNFTFFAHASDYSNREVIIPQYEGFPVPREPDISDPVIFTEAQHRVWKELGRDLRIEMKDNGGWTIASYNYGDPYVQAKLSRATEIVYQTLAELSYYEPTPTGYLMLDLDRLAMESVRPLQNITMDRFAGSADNPRKLVREVHRYIQSFDYGVPPQDFFTPDQVIQNGYGDCDTMAVFMAAILMGVEPDFRPRFIVFPDHVMLAVPIDPRRNDASVMIDGAPHVLVEVAGKGFDIGQMTRQRRQQLAQGDYYIGQM